MYKYKSLSSKYMLILCGIISVFCFIIPLFFYKFFWLVFFAFVPLIYAVQFLTLKKESFLFGFCWGLGLYGIHLYWLLVLIHTCGYGSWRYLFWILLVIWFAFCSGFWFFLQFIVLQRYKRNYQLVVVWSAGIALYLIYMIKAVLFLSGALDGYPFINPCILLAYWPGALWMLSYIDLYWWLCLYTLFQVLLVFGILKKHKNYVFGSLMILIAFLVGTSFYSVKFVPLQNITYIQPWWHISKDPMFCGYRMVHDITQVCYDLKDTSCIILPESAFPADLYGYQEFVKMLGDCDNVNIILGAQASMDESYYNSCFVLYNGQIIKRYDKRHLMPLMERSSTVLTTLGFGSLLCSNESSFSYGIQKDDVIEINNMFYQVFLCSELFFEAKQVKGLPILFLCNDHWFCCDYIKRLVPYFIDYVSMKYNLSILYATVSGQQNIS